jgi:tRNA (cmo5U34)-methyltransferase
MSSLGSANINLWSAAQHAKDYEATLLEFLPQPTNRFLDIGAGAGRLLSLVNPGNPPRSAWPWISRRRVEHDLDRALPPLGAFDAVVSSFAIHHVAHERKRTLYAEIYGLLQPGAIFLNLEHVASPNASLHESFRQALGCTVQTEDPSNKLLDFELQLGWLREIGFVDVDCHWKWREMALLAGRRPTSAQL